MLTARFCWGDNEPWESVFTARSVPARRLPVREGKKGFWGRRNWAWWHGARAVKGTSETFVRSTKMLWNKDSLASKPGRADVVSATVSPTVCPSGRAGAFSRHGFRWYGKSARRAPLICHVTSQRSGQNLPALRCRWTEQPRTEQRPEQRQGHRPLGSGGQGH